MSTNTNQAGGTIVVGIDGSQHGFWALDWAIDEAIRRDVSLRVVSALDDTFVAITLIPGEGERQLRQAAEADLRHAADAVNARGLAVDSRLEAGDAARVLLDAADDAQLLVIGSRGRGHFHHAPLGSVSVTCLAYAPCPVAVVDAPARCLLGGHGLGSLPIAC